jgi:hypothetical protein
MAGGAAHTERTCWVCVVVQAELDCGGLCIVCILQEHTQHKVEQQKMPYG